MSANFSGVRAIFFDAGGTLIHLDSIYICERLKAELAIEAAGERFRRAQYLAMHGVGQLVAAGAGSTEQMKNRFYAILLPEIGVREEQLADAVACLLNLAQGEVLWRTTEERTPAVLAALKARGLMLGVVSNSDGRIEHAFRQAGLAEYFDFFVDSFLVGVEKPDPRIFQMALAKAGVDAAEAVYVGDLYAVDVVGARRAGLVPVLYDPFRFYSDADCPRIQAISDLLALLPNYTPR